jgi:hypothetical protein
VQQLIGLDASFLSFETPRCRQHIFNVYVLGSGFLADTVEEEHYCLVGESLG